MRLTNTDKDAFVDAAIKDVPVVDYPGQVRKLVMDDAFKQLPEPIQKIVKDGVYTDYLDTTYYYADGAMCMGQVMIYNLHGEYKITDDVKVKIKELHDAFELQSEKRGEIRRKLRAVIYPVNTLKTAKDRIPEDLHKYLPHDRDSTGVAGLPAVANLMEDLNAAGWVKK